MRMAPIHQGQLIPCLVLSMRNLNVRVFMHSIHCVTYIKFVLMETSWAIVQCTYSFFTPRSCPNKDSDPVPCLAKTYGPGGSSGCLQCPAGSECPSAKLSMHVPCRNGTYADSEGHDACLQCPEGFTCPNPATSPVLCENGTYSFNGSALCSLCPAGYRYDVWHCHKSL